MKLVEQIKEIFFDELNLDADKDIIRIEPSQNEKWGDLTTSDLIRLNFDKQKEKKLLESLNNNKYIEKAGIIDPGFLNLSLSAEGEMELLKEVGRVEFEDKPKKGQKVQVEYISANPTGPLTLGNGRGAFGGETLANIYELLGAEVTREYYINNMGKQVKILADSVIKVKTGKSKEFSDEELYKGAYIKQLSKEISLDDIGKKSLLGIGQEIADLIVEKYIKPTTKKIDINFNVWQKESQLYDQGLIDKVVNKKLKEKSLIYEKDGASWFKSTKFGDEKDRVVVTKKGNYTYFASDIAYAYDKFKKRSFDKVINLWGSDHHGYIDRYRGVLEAFDWSDRWEVVLFQLVSLIEKNRKAKMSKRAGNFVLLTDFIDQVGVDVAKFVFLSKDFNTALDIDLEQVKKRSKDSPVYYIQYAFARINSIESKANKIKAKKATENYRLNDQEKRLLLELLKFRQVVLSVADNNQVHLLAYYGNDLAKKFHAFYKQSPILSAPENVRENRLELALSTKKILKSTLELIGVSQPEKM